MCFNTAIFPNHLILYSLFTMLTTQVFYSSFKQELELFPAFSQDMPHPLPRTFLSALYEADCILFIWLTRPPLSPIYQLSSHIKMDFKVPTDKQFTGKKY